MRRPASFSIIVADPPWGFSDKLPGETRGAVKNYRVLKLPQIETFLEDNNLRVADDALLFLWRVAAMPEEALRVVRAWGFVPKAELVWAKLAKRFAKPDNSNEPLEWRTGIGLAFGMGRYSRGCHETCIVASRGRGLNLVVDHGVRSLFHAPLQEHSRKPEEFFQAVERMVGENGPKVELFARQRRPGWASLGDELPL